MQDDINKNEISGAKDTDSTSNSPLDNGKALLSESAGIIGSVFSSDYNESLKKAAKKHAKTLRPKTKQGSTKKMTKQKRIREYKLKRRIFLIGSFIIAALAFVVFLRVIIKANAIQSQSMEHDARTSKSAETNDPNIRTVSILGTGDNLIHEQLYLNAAKEDGTYDFTPLYTKVRDQIRGADLATVNQESPIATSIYPPSGYPWFNTPEDIGTALIDAGFDVINEGNNHILDKGSAGAFATMDYWDSVGIPYVGIYRHDDDLFDIRIIEKNDCTVAFMSVVEFINEPFEAGTNLRTLWLNDEAKVEGLIRLAKSKADILVVHVHWGIENSFTTTAEMERMAQNMVDWGADVIYGNHPHVLQRLDILTRSSDNTLCPVIYSLGNFVSGQKSREQLVSGLLTVTFEKNLLTGRTKPSTMNFTPTVTHYEGDRRDVTIYPLDEYTEELAGRNGVATFTGEPLTLDFINSIVEEQIPTPFLNKTGVIQ